MTAPLHAIVPYLGACRWKLVAIASRDADESQRWFEIPPDEPVVVMGYGEGWCARVIYDGVDTLVPHACAGPCDLVDLFEPTT